MSKCSDTAQAKVGVCTIIIGHLQLLFFFFFFFFSWFFWHCCFWRSFFFFFFKISNIERASVKERRQRQSEGHDWRWLNRISPLSQEYVSKSLASVIITTTAAATVGESQAPLSPQSLGVNLIIASWIRWLHPTCSRVTNSKTPAGLEPSRYRKNSCLLEFRLRTEGVWDCWYNAKTPFNETSRKWYAYDAGYC